MGHDPKNLGETVRVQISPRSSPAPERFFSPQPYPGHRIVRAPQPRHNRTLEGEEAPDESKLDPSDSDAPPDVEGTRAPNAGAPKSAKKVKKTNQKKRRRL